VPDPRPLTGLFGKVPAHGDFVRRGLPTSFVAPWDAWLQAGVARMREALGSRWAEVWDTAPAWRFALPAGSCGPDAVAGVMLPSVDQVGRRFPITLAALLAPGSGPPPEAWFDAVEAAALAGRAGRADADALAAAIPPPGADAPALPLGMLPGLDMPLPELAPFDADLPQDIRPQAEAAEVGDLLGPATLLTGSEDRDPPGTGASPGGAAAGKDEDVLGLLAGGARSSADPADHLSETPPPLPAGLPPFSAAAKPGPEQETREGDVLAFFADAGGDARETFAAPPPEAAEDGTLALLIGGGTPLPSAPEAGQTWDASLPLAASWAPAAAEPPALPLAPDPWGAAPGETAATPSPEPPPVLPSDPWDDAASPPVEPAGAPASAAVPPVPEGGGWWTRGGAHVPPMVWALACLPAPEDFAYLLEAEA